MIATDAVFLGYKASYCLAEMLTHEIVSDTTLDPSAFSASGFRHDDTTTSCFVNFGDGG